MTGTGDITSMGQVTDLHLASDKVDADAGTAVRSADAAARAAGVIIRELTDLEDLAAVYQLYDSIWRPDPMNPPVTTELLRALTKAGNYVGGAFDGTRLVGACVGFFGAPSAAAVHSHIAGVPTAMRGRRIGFALKLHQRAWALLRGVSTISWTFDPLVCRNAYFNLVKLAAAPQEYLPNFYGGMDDGINGTGDTDRLLVRWDLTAPAVVNACAGAVVPGDAAVAAASGAAIALSETDGGLPVVRPAAGQRVLVRVPPDIESLRSTDPDCAQRWRAALREVLATLLSGGGAVSGFDRAGWYIVDTGHDGQLGGRS